jgi:DNA-binding response OmpR family regulator
MPSPRILIVDDQRDISRMLRAALETLGHGYVVLDVPSAEEAQLELRRGQIDLLITDLRLPGISGLELIHKLRRTSTEAAMIVISAYADERTRAELAGLGATFFAKPLSLADLLSTVQQILAARVAAAPEIEAAPAPGLAGVTTRLGRLRRDLGALAVTLVDTTATVTARDGDFSPQAFEAVLAPLLTVFGAATQISAALGGPGPNSLTFVDGQAYDMYAAGVGAGHALLIFFEGERGALQMGPVMRFGRQCADDLLLLLSAVPPPPAPAPVIQPACQPRQWPWCPARPRAAAPLTRRRSHARPRPPSRPHRPRR